jgi:hypothetical protein
MVGVEFVSEGARQERREERGERRGKKGAEELCG